MKKKYSLLSLAIAALLLSISLSIIRSEEAQLLCFACEDGGVVDKTPCETFNVKIAFKNTGKCEGTWSVNIAFEGYTWTWSGTPQTLTLNPSKTKTLTWNGIVPCDAQINSIARLIVYYNDSFAALNWWIHIVQGAELTITSSTVK
ncbi:MAG: hypothetical protein ACUVTB_02940 [Candidatus Bathycorpusculaceae bacterium]